MNELIVPDIGLQVKMNQLIVPDTGLQVNVKPIKKKYTSVDPIYNGGIAAALALSGWRGWEFASLGVWVNE